MTGWSIAVDDVHKRFSSTEALRGVAAVFEPGRLNGLIGPDGAGKTTLFRVILGLLKPSSGGVTFWEGARGLPFDEARAGMATLPQQPSLYPDLSVGEHLDFFRDLYRLPAAVYGPRRERLLHLTRLAPFQDRPAGQLSGGMYKKLGLMCALLHTPRALLLDEPTNGVDPISRRELWDLLFELKQENILVLVATAYMDEAERCDRVYLLEKGRLWASGVPRDILEQEKAEGFAELFIRRETAPAP